MKELNLSRKEVFITSKLWNTYHHPDHVEAACRKTLKDLNVDYLDLYLIHFPIPLKFVPFEKRYPPEWVHDPSSKTQNVMIAEESGVTIAETWAAMESLLKKGLVKNIGVANFPAVLILELLKTAKVLPAMNQVELHPYLSQTRLIDFCKSKGINVTGFSPLGSAGYVEIGMDCNESRGPGLLHEPLIKELAVKYGRSPAQILLRWGVQRGTAVIPKTSSVARMIENRDLYNWDIEEGDMARIFELNKDWRFNDPGEFCKGMGGDYPLYL